jgi:murein DD-endopeptidase MepM/ murein hydrolase activator NlpD
LGVLPRNEGPAKVRGPQALALIFVALAMHPSGLGAETLALTQPALASCVTDEGALFSVENGELKPVRGQFMIFPPGGQALRPRAAVSLDGEPGQLLHMYTWSGEHLDSLSIQIGIPGKSSLTRTTGFRVQSDNGIELWAALLGIPALGAEREYTLTLRAEAGERSYLLLQPFTVTGRKFFSERIPLTADLSSMVTVPDSQKKEESRILAEVLSTPHAEAVYETGELIVPLPVGRRTSGFGDRREYDYSDGTRGYSVHLGVDIASPTGTPVPASGRGRVVFADTRILTGNTVVIEHLPGLFSVYYHMSSLGVKVGDIVEKSQAIGAVGMTGFATGPHLHWEIECEGVAVDPDAVARLPLLDKKPDFFDIEHAAAPKGGESNSLYRSQ